MEGAKGLGQMNEKPGELERQVGGFQSNNMNLVDLCNRLEGIADRLTGPEPKNGEDTGVSSPAGIIGQLQNAGGSYRENIDRLNYLVERLESLI